MGCNWLVRVVSRHWRGDVPREVWEGAQRPGGKVQRRVLGD